MVGSIIIGALLAFGLVRARSRLGRAANVIMLIPLITPEIVTGVASLMLFKGVGLQPSLTTLMIAHRLSTVREADQLVVLDNGAVVEQDTHEALVEMGGVYARLVAMNDGEASEHIVRGA